MSDYGNFSASNDSESDNWKCTPGIIPIFPVRFSQLPFNLDNVTEPSGIGSPGTSIVRTLRQGYVYIFVEGPEDTEPASSSDGVWYVFRHSTDGSDVNSDVAPSGTDTNPAGHFMFSKYEWSQSYGRGNWRYDGERHPYCWVPNWASTIWVAYSEYRWPPIFFEKGYSQAFRTQIMQRVSLRGQNTWAAYVGDASKLVEEYKPDSSRPGTLKARLDLSQTGFERRKSFPIAQSPGNEQCVAMAALFDPMGDVAELGYRLQLLNDHQTRFSAEYTYPLTMGAISKQIAPNLPKRDGILDFNSFALQPGWEVHYIGLKSILDADMATTKSVVAHAAAQLNNKSNCQLGKHLELAATEGAKGDADAIEYYSVLLGRALEGMSATTAGSAMIRKSFGEDIIYSGPTITDWISKFQTL